MTLVAKTEAHQDGWNLDYTPGSAVDAGDLVDLGQGLIGAVNTSLAANRLGSVNIRSARRYGKATSTVFAIGDLILWNFTTELAIAAAVGLDGTIILPVAICIKAAINGDDHVVGLPITASADQYSVIRPFVYEFDFETTAGTGLGVKTLLPASMNKAGLIYYHAFGIVSEVFGGAGEDQGILTLKDTESSPNTLGTITAANAGADAVGDIISSTNSAVKAADGAVIKTIAAGKGITGAITQQTAGAGEAGKMKVYLHVIPLL